MLTSQGPGGILAMLGYPGMCHFPGYTFCPKILKQDINFEEKFQSRVIFCWNIVQTSSLNVWRRMKISRIISKVEKFTFPLAKLLKMEENFTIKVQNFGKKLVIGQKF